MRKEEPKSGKEIVTLRRSCSGKRPSVPANAFTGLLTGTDLESETQIRTQEKAGEKTIPGWRFLPLRKVLPNGTACLKDSYLAKNDM